MTKLPMTKFLLIPRVRIHNANALSSPFTIGFPAMTAWLGAVHALQRKLHRNNGYKSLRFNAIAIICHAMDLQTHKNADGTVISIAGTGNPLNKHGHRSTIIETARCHLDVTLVVRCTGHSLIDPVILTDAITYHLTTMKMASGDILDFNDPEFIAVHNNTGYQQLITRLMPGYCLIERRDLMVIAMQNGLDAIDAVLNYLPEFYQGTNANRRNAKNSGSSGLQPWLVPIATGFHGISPSCKAENQRDPDTPHRFAESIVTLGDFVRPYRIEKVSDMLWHTQADLKNNLYLCQQKKSVTH